MRPAIGMGDRASRYVDLAGAAEWIAHGGIVACPTETFYGLAADPAQPAAVSAIFDLKGRSTASPLPIIAASIAAIERVCGALDGRTASVAAAFWPGPLSVIVAAPAVFAPGVDAGTGTIAVRVPGHALARDLATRCGGLLTATSANPSGEPPPTTAAALGAIAADDRVRILDGGRTAGGAPSTIVDARGTPPRLVRAGAIAWDRVLRSIHE
jgi:L-threonylcarbamoyladenylate synthase